MEEHVRSRIEFLVQDYADNLTALEGLYAETANPLFIWDAISVLNFLRDVGRRGFTVPDLPAVPEWGLAYITQVAVDLTKLANGHVVPPIDKPLSRVPHLLGLVATKGSNKFVEYRAMRRDLEIADRAEQLLRNGKTAAEADQVIKSEFGDKELSVIQKRKTSGKRLRSRIRKLVAKSIVQ